jgi:DNA-binding NtrC family response regulator
MADLLHTAGRVAATDATVLVTGESGTGKEMLAHTIHDLSGRRQKPLVIVDCSAIPASLMDSELFGRERGAYTGAERRAEGRLAQADGGTVFLDEIGELPLEVQAKLLRFVQEKTLTMVGGTRSTRVDVRIVAATNRALEDEVRAGRFREDLFHRLNVVRLRIPPLRERPDDVSLLAAHFLELFAGQYAKNLGGMDTSAERLLASHAWPGNVRELQNTMLQAVVLAEGATLTARDLQLPEPTVAPETGVPHSPAVPPPSAIAIGVDHAWQRLSTQLGVTIDEAVTTGAQLGLPLGKWLNRDLVLEAFEQHGRVISRAAEAVGLPETTFARRLRQAEAEAASTRQPESWLGVRAALGDVLRAAAGSARLADQIDELIFGLIVSRVPQRVTQAAGLMGLSVPTMKRRIAEQGGRAA